MSDDLIRRLRKFGRRFPHEEPTASLCREAADELERLRAEVERLNARSINGERSMNDDDARPAIADDDPAHSRPPKHRPSTFAQRTGKVGRNDPCPCGSGKKLKKCHVYPSGSGG